MWKFCKCIRHFRSKLREAFDVNHSHTGNNDATSSKPIEKYISKCRLQTWFDGGDFNDNKEDSSKHTWKKQEGTPIGPDFGTFLEAIGLGSALLVGAQFIWLNRERRLALKEECSKNFQLKNYCLWNLLPLTQHWLGHEAIKLSVLPENVSLPRQFDGQEISAKQLKSRKSSSFDDSDKNWNLGFNLPKQIEDDSKLQNKAEVKEDNDLLHRILPLRDELVTAANQCVAVIQNKVGLQLASENHSSQALTFFKAACDLGDSKACFNAGVCYETGLGTEQDLNKAKEFYKQAAELGHGSAMYNLGVYYMEGRGGEVADVPKGLELIESAAKLGILEAQRFMAAHYFETEEKEKAVLFLKAAAEKKDGDSQFYLGLCYENGWGVEENMPKAAELYSRAASQGHLEATYNLGVFNEFGLGGIPQDEESAEALYLKAASAGNSEAEQRLQEIKQNKKIGLENSMRNSVSSPEFSSSFFTGGFFRLPVSLTESMSRKRESSIDTDDVGTWNVFSEERNSDQIVVNVRRSSIA